MDADRALGVVELVMASTALVAAPIFFTSRRQPKQAPAWSADDRRWMSGVLLLMGVGAALEGAGNIAGSAALRTVGQLIFLAALVTMVRVNLRRMRSRN